MTKKLKADQREEYLLREKEEVIENQDSFSAFMKEQLKTSARSVKDIGESLGIGYDQMKKILNQNRPTKKRDCIIAVCFLLAMDSDLTNDALLLNSYMPVLDGDHNPRDSVIVGVLDEIREGPYDAKALDEFNKRLTAAGFEPLDIIDHKRRNMGYSKLQCPALPYKVLRPRIRSTTENPFAYDTTSLGTLYDPNNCRTTGRMWLVDNTGKPAFLLNADDSGALWVESDSEQGEFSFKAFKNPEETLEFAVYFRNLLGRVKKEKSHMNSLLADSRNFGKRIGAGLFSDKIHIFIEQYNYAMPQADEYYLFEYIDGAYRLSVSHVSLFMKKYLTEEEFTRHYGNIRCVPLHVYYSLAEIDNLLISNKMSDIDTDVLRSRRSTFMRMRADADECLIKLKERRVYVRNPEHVGDNDPGWICTFFNVESSFECKEEGEYSVLVPGKTEAQKLTNDGEPITITLDNLQRAFELGFNSIEEICRAITTYGTVEGVLQ